MVNEGTKKKVEELRESSVEFKTVFEEATSKIEELIRKRNTARSIRPKDSRDMRMRIKVTALPLTKEEMTILNRYIAEKYIRDIAGYYISIRKSIFSNNYIIKSCGYYDDLL